MRRGYLIALVIAACAVVFTGGLALAQVGGETVATQTFTHEDVVTYTIPTTTIVSTETVISTVTEPGTTSEPTTTEPPPTTTEPPPTGGTVINVTSGTWVCDRPLSAYATNGFPVIVNTNIPNLPEDNLNGDVRLMSGCVGDPLAFPDLILHINGNGSTLGSGGDGMHMGGSPGPHDIQIEGYVNCGRAQGGAHQDGVQMLYAQNITFLGFQSGDWDSQTPTCHGAGGGFYVSGNNIRNVVCDGCRFVNSTGAGAVGTGLYLGASVNSGARNSCFSANHPVTQDSAGTGYVKENVYALDRDGGGQTVSGIHYITAASQCPIAGP